QADPQPAGHGQLVLAGPAGDDHVRPVRDGDRVVAVVGVHGGPGAGGGERQPVVARAAEQVQVRPGAGGGRDRVVAVLAEERHVVPGRGDERVVPGPPEQGDVAGGARRGQRVVALAAEEGHVRPRLRDERIVAHPAEQGDVVAAGGGERVVP